MSYRVSYNPELSDRYPLMVKRRKSKAKLLMLTVFMAALAAGIFTRGTVLRFLIPGDSEVTVAAFSAMVEQVEMGESLHDAVLGFCQEIIVNGS